MLDIKSMAISFEQFGAFVSLMLGAFFFLQKNKDEIDRDIMNVVSLGALLLISNGQIKKLAQYILNNDELDKKEIKKFLSLYM